MVHHGIGRQVVLVLPERVLQLIANGIQERVTDDEQRRQPAQRLGQGEGQQQAEDVDGAVQQRIGTARRS